MNLKRGKSNSQSTRTQNGGRKKNANELVFWARQYIEHGWKVFLTPAGSKKPFKGSHGALDATDDIAVIRKVARKHPDANLAVAMGNASGLFALDLDCYKAGASEIYTELESKYGKLPETLTAQTPRGGEHLIFDCAGKAPNWQAKFGVGFDVRGNGGYVLVKPSMFEGKKYLWKTRSVKRAPIPQIWMSALRDASGYLSTKKMQSDAVIPVGARNGTLFAWACELRRDGKTQDEVLVQLRKWNEGRCQEPLPHQDIDGIANRIFKNRGGADAATPAMLDKSLPRPVRRTQTLAEIDKLKLKPLEWVIRKILPVGVILMAGAPKIGKSFMSLQMGLTVAHGSRLWRGRKREQRGEVLYLAYEDNNRRMRDRARKLLEGEMTLPKRLHVDYQWPRMDAGGVEDLDNWLSAHPKARLVIIDTLAKFRTTTSRARTAYDYDYAIGSALIPLAERHQVAIVLVHHTAKGARADVMESVNSTNGLPAGVDGILILSRDRNTKDGALFMSGRDIKERILNMERLANHRWSSLGEASDVPLTVERKRIIADLVANGPSKPQAIAGRLDQKGVTIRVLLKKMFEDGQVGVKDGLYSAKN